MNHSHFFDSNGVLRQILSASPDELVQALDKALTEIDRIAAVIGKIDAAIEELGGAKP